MEKREQYKRVFNHFDENGDGKISALELKLCMGSIGGEVSLAEAEAEAAVAVMDSDGDGLLGMEDFVRLMEGAEEEESMREAFKMYEMDGSGCITAKSLKRMLSRLGQSKSIEDCKVMIAEFDTNGDGVLNFDEFKSMMI